MSRFAPLQTRKDVWLNDLPFSSVDDLGNRWLITNIDGWWDLPAPTMGEVDRAYSEDGSYYEPGRFQSRTIRMTGKIIPASNDSNAANIARQELNKRLILVRKTGMLQVLESPELGGGKQSEVVTVARPIVSSTRLNGVIEFDIQFRAPDPRKYSVNLYTTEAFLGGSGSGSGRTYGLVYNRAYSGKQSQNTALVMNEGDYDTYGTIRLHGPIDDPGAHHLEMNRHIKFPGVRLGVGQYIDVNLGEKTIISESGVSLRDRMDDASRWFKFDVGDNRVSLLGTQYLDPVPGVPDIKNLVTNPSFEGPVAGETPRTVRRSYTRNPTGMTSQTKTTVRESAFPDPQAQDPEQFTEGAVSGGYISKASTTLLDNGSTTFPVYDSTTQHFVQMDLKPTTAAVTTSSLFLGGKTSGQVPLNTGEWTTVRVDSSVPTDDYSITLSLPGASATDRVQVRNIMVLRSSTPIAGDIPFWSPQVGVTYEGLVTEEMSEGVYVQSYSTPDVWSLPNNPESLLRVIETGDEETDGAYIIPGSDEPHVISFGLPSTTGSDITYGVLGEGVTEIRLYDGDTDELLQTTAPSHVAANYISEVPINPRVEATVNVMAAGSRVRRKISAVMVTYDGGTKIFTNETPDEGGYMYDYYSTYTPAREMVDSIVSNVYPEGYNNNARVVSDRAYDGSKSLEIVYNIVPDDEENVPATPVSSPVAPTTFGTYHVRAKIMSNKPTVVHVGVTDALDEVSYAVSAGPYHWANVAFEFEVSDDATPYVTISPSIGERDLEIYVDSVGIMTEDFEYFDGDNPGPYEWSGAPHASSSATIPVVGIPTAKMEIMHRNAWIG